MENISHYDPQEQNSAWQQMLFYLACSIFVAVVFAYGAILVKMYFQNRQIDMLNSQLLATGGQQKNLQRQEVLMHKKKIEDFGELFKNHTVATGVLSFVEKNTLGQVLFFTVSMSEGTGQVRLTGQADTMGILSQQLQFFEADKINVKSINVIDSKVDGGGKVAFTISLVANPALFAYVK